MMKIIYSVIKYYSKYPIHNDKILILNKELMLDNIKDYSICFEQALILLEKFELNNVIKSRFEKLFTLGMNMRNFNIDDAKSYNREAYIKQIEKGLEKLYNKQKCINLLDEVEMQRVSEEESDKLRIFENPETTSIFVEDKTNLIYLTNEIYDKYLNKFVIISEKTTGNFYKDVLLNLLNILMINDLSYIYINNKCSYAAPEDNICHLDSHVDIIYAMRELIILTLNVYVMNSIKDNCWSVHLEKYLSDKIEVIEMLIRKALEELKSIN